MKNSERSIKTRGFTLIELLIATTIFAMIMVIATSTFSWAVAYNGKLKEMRLTSKNGMKIAEDISTEVRLANGSPSITQYGNKIYEYSSAGDLRSGELVFMSCSSNKKSSCRLHSTLTNKLSKSMRFPVGYLKADANALLIYQRSKKRMVFYQVVKNKNLPYKKGATDEEDLYNFSIYKRIKNVDDWPDIFSFNASDGWDSKKINNEKISSEVKFGGFGPVSSERDQQPFVEFSLVTRSLDYENLKVGFRDTFEIITTVETREYNKP